MAIKMSKSVKVVLGAAGAAAVIILILKFKGGGGGGGEEKSHIAVNTAPSGANIYINGTYAGKSPGSFEVSAGSYTVKAQLAGYNDATQSVTVAAGETKNVNITLTPAGGGGKGHIQVNTTPTGANIYINDAYAGKSPGSFEVSAGSYTVKAQLSGYNDATQSVTVAAGETKNVNITLTASGGGGGEITYDFSCNQPTVTPDPVQLGQPVLIKCPIVSHCNKTVQVRVRMEVAESSWLPAPGDLLDTQTSDYVTVDPEQTVTFNFTHNTKGAAGSKDISVFPQVDGQDKPGGNHFDDAFHVTEGKGHIQVNTTPTGANIYINDAYAGKSPGSFEVSAGSYTVKAQLSGYNDATQSVTVAAGETKNVNITLTASGGGGELTVQLYQPRVAPEPSQMGRQVDIFCPIGFVGGKATDLVEVKIRIAESSFWPAPGDELKVFSAYMQVSPGETQEIVATWTTTGAHGSKDVTVEVYSYPGKVLLEANHFDDAFHVI